MEKVRQRHISRAQGSGGIDGNDLRLHLHQLLDLLHRRRDVNRAVRIVAFHDADDRKAGYFLNLFDVLFRVGPDSGGSALFCRSRHSPHDKG